MYCQKCQYNRIYNAFKPNLPCYDNNCSMSAQYQADRFFMNYQPYLSTNEANYLSKDRETLRDTPSFGLDPSKFHQQNSSQPTSLAQPNINNAFINQVDMPWVDKPQQEGPIENPFKKDKINNPFRRFNQGFGPSFF